MENEVPNSVLSWPNWKADKRTSQSASFHCLHGNSFLLYPPDCLLQQGLLLLSTHLRQTHSLPCSSGTANLCFCLLWTKGPHLPSWIIIWSFSLDFRIFSSGRLVCHSTSQTHTCIPLSLLCFIHLFSSALVFLTAEALKWCSYTLSTKSKQGSVLSTFR